MRRVLIGFCVQNEEEEEDYSITSTETFTSSLFPVKVPLFAPPSGWIIYLICYRPRTLSFTLLNESLFHFIQFTNKFMQNEHRDCPFPLPTRPLPPEKRTEAASQPAGGKRM